VACVLIKDHRIEFAMMQPTPNAGITFTQPSQWSGTSSVDGKRVGTVNGDSVGGFIARDLDHLSIGRRYLSAEAAMQVWAPVVDSQP